ncbi:MAG: hypothetical protein Q9194_007205, partial [Teloschistes cf. exilis]
MLEMQPKTVRPNSYVGLCLPSGSLTIQEIKPNTSSENLSASSQLRTADHSPSTISLGKYGSFQSNFLIGRPFHYTYEILDQIDEKTGSGLRIIPPSELYAGIHDEGAQPPADLEEDEAQAVNAKEGAQFEIVDQKGEVLVRTNRNIVDDA